MSDTRLTGLRRFSIRFVNPVTRHVAGRLPGFGIVHTVGRRSGRAYAVPLMIFGHEGDVVVALTYGPNVDWVRNVQAAGGCELEHLGRRSRLVDPRVDHDPAQRAVPLPIRLILRAVATDDFLRLRPFVPETGAEDGRLRREIASSEQQQG
jgi:deazaflavin-dependent oxidoreductase (nitroreductase family)